jgi:hypothetical protein
MTKKKGNAGSRKSSAATKAKRSANEMINRQADELLELSTPVVARGTRSWPFR